MRISVERSVLVAARPGATYAFFWDVRRSMEGAPGIEACTEVGRDQYRVTHTERTLGPFTMSAAYTVEYHGDGRTRIGFETVPDDDGLLGVGGRIGLSEEQGKTRVRVSQELDVRLPIPRLLAGVLRDRAREEAARSLDAFLENARLALERSAS